MGDKRGILILGETVSEEPDSSLGTLRSGLAMPILTSIQMFVPLGSEMWMSAARAARASREYP